MRADGIHIALLTERLGANGTTAIRKQHIIAKRRSPVLTVAQDGQAARDIVDRQRPSGGSLAKSMLEKAHHELDLVRVTAHGDTVATGDHVGANQALERTKDAVAGTQNARGINSIGNGKSNLRGFHEPPCVHGPSRNHRLR